MLNGIFVFIVLTSILFAAVSGRMQPLTKAMLDSASAAVTLAIGLVGVMALFLGLLRVAEDSGLMRKVSRLVGPVLRLLFPSIPQDHPAMSAMILNISSNMLGLGNAATPFGIKAMQELDRLNASKGTASDAMVLFLAINTAGFAILPSQVISVRAAAGSEDPTGILLGTWIASACATIAGVLAAILLSRLPRYRATRPAMIEDDGSGPAGRDAATAEPRATRWRRAVLVGFWVAFVLLLTRWINASLADLGALNVLRDVVSFWVLPIIVGSLILFGWSRGVKVYESIVEGAKEGFQVALRIIPYLVAILVAVGMFRASGGIELLVWVIGPVTALIQMPAEALPMAMVRPLSGSGALGVMVEIMEAHGPDSRIGYMVSTIQGSTETTFYVLAVYFGAVGVKRTRHALPACLLADAAGILTAVLVVNLLLG